MTADALFEKNQTIKRLTPVECYLHRTFPPSTYDESATQIIEGRIFKPRNDCENFYLTIPVDWEAKDHMIDRNWRMQLQSWTVFHPIMNFFDSFDEKDKILAFFLEICADWWSNYGSDPDDIVTSRQPDSYAWYDMSVGFRALIIAFFIERIEHYNLEIDSNHKKILEKLIN